MPNMVGAVPPCSLGRAELKYIGVAGAGLDEAELPELPAQQSQHGAVDVVQADARGAQRQAGALDLQHGLVQLRLCRAESSVKEMGAARGSGSVGSIPSSNDRGVGQEVGAMDTILIVKLEDQHRVYEGPERVRHRPRLQHGTHVSLVEPRVGGRRTVVPQHRAWKRIGGETQWLLSTTPSSSVLWTRSMPVKAAAPSFPDRGPSHSSLPGSLRGTNRMAWSGRPFP
ncbi:hypothetical protein EYF80_034153 [Liparis tanakae]|uniref:Uncharacterized protein n=1 Tax=Liparis tanakae TaxID=230148 RepID=A0A4Z2GQ05_9TELE|nr:hypothetical protein EYF80_034153 [Liparis tanakae]